jgi:hypothetical protein
VRSTAISLLLPFESITIPALSSLLSLLQTVGLEIPSLSESGSSVLTPRASDSIICPSTSSISGKLRSSVMKVARAFPSSDSTSTVIGTLEIRLVSTLAVERKTFTTEGEIV